MIVAVHDDRRCIVVGAGLLGLSAAWALSRRQWRVTVLEAADAMGHDRSGSKGDARIFRLGYPEPVYVDMAVRARALWHDLEAASGRRLLHGRGQVTFGDEVALDAIAAALAAAGAPSERLAPGEAARRFPAIAVHGSVLFEPDSCVLAADQCLRALGDVADFVLRTGERVRSLRQGRDSVTVATASGRTLERRRRRRLRRALKPSRCSTTRRPWRPRRRSPRWRTSRPLPVRRPRSGHPSSSSGAPT